MKGINMNGLVVDGRRIKNEDGRALRWDRGTRSVDLGWSRETVNRTVYYDFDESRGDYRYFIIYHGQVVEVKSSMWGYWHTVK